MDFKETCSICDRKCRNPMSYNERCRLGINSSCGMAYMYPGAMRHKLLLPHYHIRSMFWTWLEPEPQARHLVLSAHGFTLVMIFVSKISRGTVFENLQCDS